MGYGGTDDSITASLRRKYGCYRKNYTVINVITLLAKIHAMAGSEYKPLADHSLTHSLIHSLAHSLTHSLTYLLTYLLTHSLLCNYKNRYKNREFGKITKPK